MSTFDEAKVQEILEAFVAEHRDDEVGNVATKKLFENERVRVWEMNLEPNEASDLHHHELDYLVVQLEGDCVVGIPPPESGRDPMIVPVRVGRAGFVRKGGTEWALNIGKQRYREILIELKEPADRAGGGQRDGKQRAE